MGGLEKRHGVSSFNLEEGGVGTVGALVSVMSFVLATETSDAGVRDAVSASNNFARLHKCHAIFFLDCRLLAARVAARVFPLGRLEIDKQAVGCGQVDGILVVSSGERAILRRSVALSVSDETAAVASSKPGSSPMAPP